MKQKILQKNIFPEKVAQKKPLIYGILAAGSFLVLLILCVRLRGDGIALLLCLILHTCSLLLLYRDALMAIDPEDWKTEAEWMQEDLPPEEAAEQNPTEPAVPYHKSIYAEVRQSLIEAPAILFPDAETKEASAENPPEASASEESAAEETIAEEPTSEEEPAENPDPSSPQGLHAFLTAPQKPVEMDLIAAAKDAMASLTPFADAQNIKLHLSSSCETLLMKADPESIRILFRNIIDNSIKYMGRSGHMIITISLLGDDIFLILKDTGNGLAEEETRHVFELNFQGSNRVSGNGLGLTQTKMIVEAFGGTIYAKSSPGNGMAIYIQLPVLGKPQ